MSVNKIDQGVFRILIPFENITTTVYVYEYEQEVAIVDSANSSLDVDKYILPTLHELNIPFERVKLLLLTHDHGDHCGGLKRLAEVFTEAAIGTSFDISLPGRVELSDGRFVLGSLMAVLLPGHTSSSFGFYDVNTKTLLSGDCLQLDGIGKYRSGISDVEKYINSVNKLKSMDIKRIVAAHEYEPFGSIAEGKSAVEQYLNECIKIAERRKL